MIKTGRRATRMSRREVMRLLGAGAGVGLAACGGSTSIRVEVGDEQESSQETPVITFPEGAVVRTVLGDMAPEALAGGATLFHEHVSFNYSSPPAADAVEGVWITSAPPHPTIPRCSICSLRSCARRWRMG